MEGLLVIGVLMAAVLAVVGYWIAEEKRRDGVEGAVLGCLLGPFGLLIEAVLPTGEVRSAPVATSTTSTPRSGPEPPRAEYYAWQALYVPYDFVAGPEDSREPAGPDGPPPGWAKFDAKTPTANLIAAMAGAERHYSGELGFRVVEAVWQPGTRPTILAAFGDPAKTYDLLWPEYPRVRWTSRVGTEGSWEANGPTDVPELIVPTRAASGPSEAASEDKPGSAGSSASVAPEERRPTKTCPDCAETILEPARICRFCRYEFWPADALPSGPPSDEPDTADEVSVRAHVEEAGDVAEADAGEQAPVPTEAQTVVPEQGAPQPQPGPPAAVQQPAATEPEVEPEAVEVPPPAAPPPLPSYAPPPPSYLPPSTAPPPSGWPAPPSYAPQQPPYTPPPPAWQPPPQGPPPPSQGPWAPPPPRPPDRPRE